MKETTQKREVTEASQK